MSQALLKEPPPEVVEVLEESDSQRGYLRHLLDKNSKIFVEFLAPPDKWGRKTLIKKEVVDFSSTGLAFKSDLDEDIPTPGTILDRLWVLSSDTCLFKSFGKIHHLYYSFSDSGEPCYKVGVEFLKRTLRGKGRSETKFTTEEEAACQISAIINSKLEIIFKRKPDNASNHGIIQRLLKNNTLKIIPKNPTQNFNSVEIGDTITTYYAKDEDTFSFQSPVLDVSPQSLKIPYPKRIQKLWRRAVFRHLPNNKKIKVNINHPFLAETKLSFPVMDLTPTGLSFKTVHAENFFIEGMEVREMELVFEDRTIDKISAEIRYVECLDSGNERKKGDKCGLKFSVYRREDEDFILDYLFKQTFPKLTSGEKNELSELWDFYHESGFIYREKLQKISVIKKEIEETYRKIYSSENAFHKNFIFKEHGHICASVSAIRAYEKTWMIQHLTSLKHPTEILSKKVNLAITDFCSKASEVEYQKIYWRPQNKWPEKLFGTFAKKISGSKLSHTELYNYLEVQMVKYKNIPFDDTNITTEPIKTAHLKFIESFFVARNEFIILKADSLLREDINLPVIGGLYKEKGLKRERKIFVAFHNDVFAGMVLVENSSLLLNLSGLLNCFKIYTQPFAEDQLIEKNVKQALMQRAVQFYKKQKRTRAIFLTPDQDLTLYQEHGFEKTKEYRCWTSHKSLAQPYYNFVNNVYSKIERRLKRTRAQ